MLLLLQLLWRLRSPMCYFLCLLHILQDFSCQPFVMNLQLLDLSPAVQTV